MYQNKTRNVNTCFALKAEACFLCSAVSAYCVTLLDPQWASDFTSILCSMHNNSHCILYSKFMLIVGKMQRAFCYEGELLFKVIWKTSFILLIFYCHPKSSL